MKPRRARKESTINIMSSNDKEKTLELRGAREFVEYSVESVNFPLESSYADALKVFRFFHQLLKLLEFLAKIDL